jgi:hypothetical protein
VTLPPAPPQYNARNEAQTREAIAQADAASHKKGQDIELGAAKLILKSPNGTRWALTVSNAGALSATAL